MKTNKLRIIRVIDFDFNARKIIQLFCYDFSIFDQNIIFIVFHSLVTFYEFYQHTHWRMFQSLVWFTCGYK